MAKILLIDDDIVLLKLYSTRLAADGHEVTTVSNGEEGLETVRSFKPDLVILDLLMPRLNGFGFLEALRADRDVAHTPVVVFSSVAQGEQIERLRSLGVSTYLNKITTTPTELVSIAQQHLAEKKSK